MKKKLLIAAIVVLSLGTTATILHAKSFTGHTHGESEGILNAGMRCTFCNGTGFQGPNSPFNCSMCKGTGRNLSY